MPEQFADDFAGFPDMLIPRGVPFRVVDLFQVVDIQNHDGKFLRIIFRDLIVHALLGH